jgi:hypothetical protein
MIGAIAIVLFVVCFAIMALGGIYGATNKQIWNNERWREDK